jgi:glycogen synthase
MNILLASHFFYPSVGGIEQVSSILAREFCAAGHEVRVITTTRYGRDSTRPRSSSSSSSDHQFEFEDEDDTARERLCVIRRPSPLQLCQVVRWADVVFHNNISLRFAWPLLTVRRRWVVAHHTWLTRVDGSIGWPDKLKLFAIRFATNIAVSSQIEESLCVPSIVIGNPYQNDTFRRDAAAIRDRDLVFVGRLVSDKGVDILLKAIDLLRTRGVIVSLSIVGDGPLQGDLKCMSEGLRLAEQIEFLGLKTGSDLAAILNRHRAIVVPSRWREPFGLVAIEGVACGCKAIVPDSGPFRETLGACAILFKSGSPASLADAIEATLAQGPDPDYWQQANRQLCQYQANVVAARYLEVLARA